MLEAKYTSLMMQRQEFPKQNFIFLASTSYNFASFFKQYVE